MCNWAYLAFDTGENGALSTDLEKALSHVTCAMKCRGFCVNRRYSMRSNALKTYITTGTTILTDNYSFANPC